MILQRCIQIREERWSSYWTVKDNFSRWREIHKNLYWEDLTELQLAQIMVSMKFSRERNKHKEDNIIDLINYLDIAEELREIWKNEGF